MRKGGFRLGYWEDGHEKESIAEGDSLEEVLVAASEKAGRRGSFWEAIDGG